MRLGPQRVAARAVVQVVACTLLALLACLADLASGARDTGQGKPLATIGYHEGTRRTVTCSNNGTWIGLEARFYRERYKYSEAHIAAIKLLCSTGSADVQWFGAKPESYIYGRDMNATELVAVKAAKCDPALGIGGIAWRTVKLRDPANVPAEARIAGVTLMCNRAANAPAPSDPLDLTPDAQRQLQFACKRMPQYGGLPTPKLSKFDLWWNQKGWVGLDAIECS